MATMSSIVASQTRQEQVQEQVQVQVQDQEQEQEHINKLLQMIDIGNRKVESRFIDYDLIIASMAEVIQKHKLAFQCFETKRKIFLSPEAMDEFLNKINIDMSNIIMKANDTMRSYTMPQISQIITSVNDNVIPARTYASVTVPITPTQSDIRMQSNLMSIPSGSWADDVDAATIQVTIEHSFITDIENKLFNLFSLNQMFKNYKFIGFLNEDDFTKLEKWQWDTIHEVGVLPTIFNVINECFEKFMKETCDNAVIGEDVFASFPSKAHTNTIMYKDSNDKYHCIYLDTVFLRKRNGYDQLPYMQATKYAKSKKMMVKFYHSKDDDFPEEFIHDGINRFNHMCGWKFTSL